VQLQPSRGSAISGRVIVVSGAANGIGKALALGFARDGALVVGIDRDERSLGSLAHAGVLTVIGDVTEPSTFNDVTKLTTDHFGRVDVLVNNAGIACPGRIDELDPAAFSATMAVHVFAALSGIKAVAPVMRSQRYGRIINLLSRAAELCLPGNVAYSSAKAALWALTRTAAAELADCGILVNGLIPGMTNTAIWGRPRPELQPPEAVYPTALALATLPEHGPSGRVFWNLKEYRLFERTLGSAGGERSSSTKDSFPL